MTIVKPKDLYYLSVMMLVALSRGGPPGCAEGLAGAVGRLAFRLSRRKRAAIEASLAQALGDLSEDERRSITAEVFRECWMELLGCGSSPSERRAAVGLPIEGLDRLHAGLARGHGVILWESRGFGRRMTSKQILTAHGFTVHQIHGPNNLGGLLTEDASASWVRRRVVRPFFDRIERKSVASIHNLAGDGTLASARHLLRLLRENAILCITGDGQVGQRLRPVTFLSHSGLASTGMVTLAEMTGATILPMFCAREGHRVALVIEPPIVINEALDRESRLRDAVQQFMDRLETWVKRHPGQLRNWHLVGPATGGVLPSAELADAEGAGLRYH